MAFLTRVLVLKGAASMTTIAFLTRVLVLTNSLLAALYTTSMIRVLRENSLAWPGEVTLIKSESTVFLVSSSDAKGVDSLRSQLGHGSWTGQLELPLLADGGPFATGGAAL